MELCSTKNIDVSGGKSSMGETSMFPSPIPIPSLVINHITTIRPSTQTLAYFYRGMSRRLEGWRYAAFLGGFVGFLGLAIYPTIIHPMMYPEEYKKIQAITRKDIRQEDIQPGNMKVWSDPFGRKSDTNERK